MRCVESVFVSSSTNSTYRGIMNRGIARDEERDEVLGQQRLPRVQDHDDLHLVLAQFGGDADEADSATAGCSLTALSTSNEEMFSPRRRMASLIRSTKK